MKNKLILLESEYLETGESFSIMLEKAINMYVKNIFITSYDESRQSFEDGIKYK